MNFTQLEQHHLFYKDGNTYRVFNTTHASFLPNTTLVAKGKIDLINNYKLWIHFISFSQKIF